MTARALIGLQWGDEGKGKMVDVLSADADLVVRCQGGSNAGHTVKVGDVTTILHLIPSGILSERARCIIGNGVVIDPEQLLKEIAVLEDRGLKMAGRLFVSDRAHVVFPHHKERDSAQEKARKGAKIGTTKKGIGPAYEDKVSRSGIRMWDLHDEASLRLKLRPHVEATAAGFEKIVAQFLDFGRSLAPYRADTVAMVIEGVEQGKKLFLEGAQGSLLDLDLGTYPFVTSSNTNLGGLLSGCGLPPRAIKEVVGVSKAYSTRVGSGPYPTELEDAVGDKLRVRGNEFGTTTGRPRRCGWFDGVAIRFACAVNGVDSIALTKLDVLSGFETLKIATAYEIGGHPVTHFPADAGDLERAQPVYEEYPGWQDDISEIRRYDDLPGSLRRYIEVVEDLSRASVRWISMGPRREDIIERN
ncbi:MAG: adenylosuccinate synthase [Planctomycetota bacterium]